MNPADPTIDYRLIAQLLGYVLMGVLSFFGTLLWKDVRLIKEKWITRDDFNDAMARSNVERDLKHNENTGSFRRLEEKLEQVEQRHHNTSLSIEQRLGEVLVKIAEIRPPPRPDGPERRRF
jgi:hypothetical protein